MNTTKRGFGFHDAFYDGTQFMWDRQGHPAAYEPANGNVSGDDELAGDDDELSGDDDELSGDDDELSGDDELTELSGGDALGCLEVLGIDFGELVEMGYDPEELMELGFSFKKLARGVAKGVKKVGKVALKVAKVAAPIAAFVVPGGVALTAGIAGADKLISAAQKGSKAAKKAYSATKALAASGHPDAKKALAVLSQVNAKRKAAGVPPGQPLPLKPAAQAALQRDSKQLQKPVAVPSANDATAGYFVDLHGRTKHGRFRAA